MKKIAIIGPESTGKSTLTKGLADYFREPYVAEYGREYLEINGPSYQKTDLLQISKGMLEAEKSQAQKAKDFLFCDTDLIMMKVWYVLKYGHCHPFVLENLKKPSYYYHLLCVPDLPWEEDPLRENPNSREQLFDQYQDELRHYGLQYSLISGKKDRLHNAIRIIKNLD